MRCPAIRHEIDIVGNAAPDHISRVVRGLILIDTADPDLNATIQERYRAVDQKIYDDKLLLKK